MKNLVIPVLLVLFGFNAGAQSLSSGVRTGGSYWMKGDGLKTAQGPHLSWDQEVFMRYESGKRFALELGASHSLLNGRHYIEYGCFGNPRYAGDVWFINSNVFQVMITPQLKIMNRTLSNGTSLRQYVGVSVGYALKKSEKKTVISNDNDESEWLKLPRRTNEITTGVCYDVYYQCSKQLFITSSLRFGVNALDFFSRFSPASDLNPDSRLGLQVGAGYRFR